MIPMRLFYDNKIIVIRCIVIALAIVNAVISAVHFWKRNWLMAATSAFWIVSLVAGLYVLRVAQETRDEVRVMLAAMYQKEPK